MERRLVFSRSNGNRFPGRVDTCASISAAEIREKTKHGVMPRKLWTTKPY